MSELVKLNYTTTFSNKIVCVFLVLNNYYIFLLSDFFACTKEKVEKLKLKSNLNLIFKHLFFVCCMFLLF
jgi:hypothetical protein